MMNKDIMKKVLATTALTAGSYLSLATSAFAQGSNVNPCPSSGQFSKLCNLNANNIGGIIGAGVTFVLVIVTIVALFYLIWGGFSWITSGGDKSKVDSARQKLTAAIIGLVIAFLAFFVLSLALSFFGLSLTNLTLPKIPTL
jgi:type IV secretion system pilin